MRKILIIVAIITGTSSIAQEVNLSDNQLNANIIPITLTYEKKIDSNKSFALSAGIIPTVVAETRTSAFNSTTEVYAFLQPYITGTFRNYYSRNKVKKNNLRNNSGNYIGVLYAHRLKPFGSTDDIFEQRVLDRNTNVFIVGPVWGIERNYASGIHLNLNLGFGYTNGEFLNTGDVDFIADFTLGFVLFSN